MLQLGGIEIRDGPIGDAALAPEEQVVAVLRRCLRRNISAPWRTPHEHIYSMQTPPIHQCADAALMYIIEPPAQEGKALRRQILHLRRKINATSKPRFDGMAIRRCNLNRAVLLQRANVRC